MPIFTSTVQFFLNHLDGNGLVVTDPALINSNLNSLGLAPSYMLTIDRPHDPKPYTLPLYQAIANTVSWKPPASYVASRDFRIKYYEVLLPHGSGFDSGCKIDLVTSSHDKLVIDFSYHHMDSMGGYIGWTDHILIIEPSLVLGFTMDISSGNYFDLDQMGILDEETDEWYPKSFDDDEDYFYQTFRDALEQQINPYPKQEEQNA